MSEVFRTTRRVEFCETDMAGIAHFANFYIYMEQAEHELFRTLGLELINRQDDGTVISWPRVSASCSFNAPARFEDVLDVSVFVKRIGVKSVTFGIEFHRGETRIAHGQLKTVCCHFGGDEEMKSIKIPGEYRSQLEQYV
ncbi:MAG: acyl-CoA thioesterase [Planctomycetaceae bacterium]|jgi:acyl-CoA thioester hydrolase|nr:acyl-CoA thioesterase [Planctomycetaceae bacterium]MBT6154701.1 acyl-CoA thioesterase [Planctomycetaceae bacterium]MBT6485899.1 acyl-CoA thioesterase [Planctomycetaceae bacterium]MBT6493471.1 acyl-CoA thioesterase [Planctomycetaceae bacterium]